MLTVRKAMMVFLAFALLAVGACATHQYEGAAVGGAVGGAAGAMLDDSNPWRGGLIGAALGAIFGATISDVSVRGSREVIDTGRPVEYRTSDGSGVYRADPAGPYDPRTKCRKVQERVWEGGKLIKDETKEYCESEKIERRY